MSEATTTSSTRSAECRSHLLFVVGQLHTCKKVIVVLVPRSSRARRRSSVASLALAGRRLGSRFMAFPGDLRERFLATPLVTRHLIASTWIAVVLNVVVGLDDLVCASPHDIVRGGQLWRLALSLFYVPGALNALIVSFVLYRLAAAWERERGSIRLAYYFLVAVVSTNLGVCVLAVVVAPVVPSVLSPSFLCGPGILAAFLVLITRSSQAYGGANVSVLGAFQIPSRAFPLLLLAFFSVFGANPLESAASVAVGYAWAQGHLDAIMPGDRTLESIERHACVAPVANARGYVGVANAGPGLPIQMAPGSGAGAAGGGGSASAGAAAARIAVRRASAARIIAGTNVQFWDASTRRTTQNQIAPSSAKCCPSPCFARLVCPLVVSPISLAHYSVYIVVPLFFVSAEFLKLCKTVVVGWCVCSPAQRAHAACPPPL